MDTAAVYAKFAESQALNGRSPTYQDWARGVAADPELCSLLDALPPARRQPNLLFAAARLVGAPSARWAEVRPWLLDAWHDVEREMRARTTQTNEPRRCATFLPALAALDAPVALIEVGASAGLCLLPDRYSYEYTSPDGTRARVDPAGGPSEVLLPCAIEGPVPVRMPEIIWRAGLDLNPLDVRDPADLAWLEALVWPEHTDRLETLRAAARVVATDPPRVIKGDLLVGLRDLVDAAPAGATVVVLHSAVLCYLTETEKSAFAATMSDLRRSHGVVWLSNEGWTVLPDVAAQLPEGLSPQFILARDGEPVALADPHGRSVRLL
ncbi:DUF2332 domain-containing protein [Promicromonospora vindobonensis]|uniref:DUF2332 domain-containing protein n=1 Tax=Promicromonospora vindobonensis TaxID=195748 RepID=A0ABW5VLR7_9MICO